MGGIRGRGCMRLLGRLDGMLRGDGVGRKMRVVWNIV